MHAKSLYPMALRFLPYQLLALVLLGCRTPNEQGARPNQILRCFDAFVDIFEEAIQNDGFAMSDLPPDVRRYLFSRYRDAYWPEATPSLTPFFVCLLDEVDVNRDRKTRAAKALLRILKDAPCSYNSDIAVEIFLFMPFHEYFCHEDLEQIRDVLLRSFREAVARSPEGSRSEGEDSDEGVESENRDDCISFAVGLFPLVINMRWIGEFVPPLEEAIRNGHEEMAEALAANVNAHVSYPGTSLDERSNEEAGGQPRSDTGKVGFVLCNSDSGVIEAYYGRFVEEAKKHPTLFQAILERFGDGRAFGISEYVYHFAGVLLPENRERGQDSEDESGESEGDLLVR